MRNLLILSVFSIATLVACNGGESSPGFMEADGVALDSFSYTPIVIADSITLDLKGDIQPMASYVVESITMTSGSAAFRKMVQDSLLLAYANGGVSDELEPIPASYENYIASSKKAYEATGREAEAEAEEFPISFMQQEEMYVRPLLNNGTHFTVAVESYTFLGGAHGFGYTHYYNFADNPARLLTAKDVFTQPIDLATFNKLLTAQVNTDDLFEAEKGLPFTDNFALTTEGVRFAYAPYDVAPYAVGEVVVTLSYAELKAKGLLKDGVLPQ